jgi:hypothetical protein
MSETESDKGARMTRVLQKITSLEQGITRLGQKKRAKIRFRDEYVRPIQRSLHSDRAWRCPQAGSRCGPLQDGRSKVYLDIGCIFRDHSGSTHGPTLAGGRS